MNALIFIIIGVILAIVELLVMDFTFIFFSAGFFITGLLSFGFHLDWDVQILLSFVLSFVLLIALKRPLKSRFFKPEEKLEDNFLDESGTGTVKNGMVYFKGTFWKSDEISEFDEGDRVEILGVKNGQIVVKKDSSRNSSGADGVNLNDGGVNLGDMDGAGTDDKNSNAAASKNAQSSDAKQEASADPKEAQSER
ncbi:NfeD family protein [uncultured Campylobacter sp.]|uniref:NfeD family protein n=1 Tax=uncultured Campylobacter sp. TaxID=218934 RepID=UPI0026043E21|nr:NfeD family protein [uncultured Campylobacter sp.]